MYKVFHVDDLFRQMCTRRVWEQREGGVTWGCAIRKHSSLFLKLRVLWAIYFMDDASFQRFPIALNWNLPWIFTPWSLLQFGRGEGREAEWLPSTLAFQLSNIIMCLLPLQAFSRLSVSFTPLRGQGNESLLYLCFCALSTLMPLRRKNAFLLVLRRRCNHH